MDVSEEELLIIVICVSTFKVIHHYFLRYFCAANMKVLNAHYDYKLLFVHVIHASVHVSCFRKKTVWCLHIHYFLFALCLCRDWFCGLN